MQTCSLRRTDVVPESAANQTATCYRIKTNSHPYLHPPLLRAKGGIIWQCRLRFNKCPIGSAIKIGQNLVNNVYLTSHSACQFRPAGHKFSRFSCLLLYKIVSSVHQNYLASALDISWGAFLATGIASVIYSPFPIAYFSTVHYHRYDILFQRFFDEFLK